MGTYSIAQIVQLSALCWNRWVGCRVGGRKTPQKGYMYALLCLVTQSCPTLYDFMDCSMSGYSVHRDSPVKNTGMCCHALLQGISQPRDRTWVSDTWKDTKIFPHNWVGQNIEKEEKERKRIWWDMQPWEGGGEREERLIHLGKTNFTAWGVLIPLLGSDLSPYKGSTKYWKIALLISMSSLSGPHLSLKTWVPPNSLQV